LIASDASLKGSRESIIRGGSAQIAEGIPLEEKISKKKAQKGTGQGQAKSQRRSLLIVSAEVKKLEKEAKAAKLAADKANKANTGKSKRSETEPSPGRPRSESSRRRRFIRSRKQQRQRNRKLSVGLGFDNFKSKRRVQDRYEFSDQEKL
jgi:hypothetical protein